MAKFIRFVSAEQHPTVDGEMGMFQARQKIDFTTLPGKVQRAHEEAWFWFSANGGGGLTYPRLQGKARTQKVRKAVFWFRSDACFFGHEKGSVVRRARELAVALTAAGIEIRELHSDFVGDIIWEDTKQVLACPSPNGLPRAFQLTA